MASVDEIKEIVTRTLETKGVLGKIRAELRASVFTAIDEQEKESGIYLENAAIQKLQSTPEGRLAAELVREFLEFYELDYTLSVLLPEANLPEQYQGRDDLSREMELRPEGTKRPLLVELIDRYRKGRGAPGGHAPPVHSPVGHHGEPTHMPRPSTAPVGHHAPGPLAGAGAGGAGLGRKAPPSNIRTNQDDLDGSTDSIDEALKAHARKAGGGGLGGGLGGPPPPRRGFVGEEDLDTSPSSTSGNFGTRNRPKPAAHDDGSDEDLSSTVKRGPGGAGGFGGGGKMGEPSPGSAGSAGPSPSGPGPHAGKPGQESVSSSLSSLTGLPSLGAPAGARLGNLPPLGRPRLQPLETPGGPPGKTGGTSSHGNSDDETSPKKEPERPLPPPPAPAAKQPTLFNPAPAPAKKEPPKASHEDDAEEVYSEIEETIEDDLYVASEEEDAPKPSGPSKANQSTSANESQKLATTLEFSTSDRSVDEGDDDASGYFEAVQRK
eukprot:tig00021621_g22969.t1